MRGSGTPMQVEASFGTCHPSKKLGKKKKNEKRRSQSPERQRQRHIEIKRLTHRPIPARSDFISHKSGSVAIFVTEGHGRVTRQQRAFRGPVQRDISQRAIGARLVSAWKRKEAIK
jgi:hypothetical protein